jgi:hypothetical protein
VANKETVGQASQRLKSRWDNQPLYDTGKEMLKGLESRIMKTVELHKDWDEPFYIVVRHKKQRLITNAVREQIYARKTRPTPAFDTIVYMYDPKKGDLIYQYALPSEQTYNLLVINKNKVKKKYELLLKHCLDLQENKL